MKDFVYDIPTRIYFGVGQISVLGQKIKEYGKRVLLVYGGGSIKRNGVYEKVTQNLRDNGIDYWELSGVEPNPGIETVRLGISLAREHNIHLLLPVGGGSAIDCSKAIAGGFFYQGDPWDLPTGRGQINDALPLAVVLTASATGSEMNASAIISNTETNQKLGIRHPSLRPKFAVLDPTFTYSVPNAQTAAGTADIMIHAIEIYFSREKGTYLQDRLAEGIMKTCVKYGPIALKEPRNYEARSNLMWASSLALNGILALGRGVQEWSVHPIQHSLSAYHDHTHGAGLAVLIPHWMKHVLGPDTLWKFVEYGVNVWGINSGKEDLDIAQEAIKKTTDFFKSMGLPSTLRELGIEEDNLSAMAESAIRDNKGPVGSFKPLSLQDIKDIYKKSM